jgi:transcription initiation factor TFIIIB Brf1 subunit/transcription initiation factor TFIIB
MYFLKIQKNFISRQPTFRKFGWRDIASYALYETLSREGASRTKREIEFFTGCKTAKLFEIESALALEETLEDPSDYIERYAISLGLSRQDSAKMRSVFSGWDFLHRVSSQCAAAVTIHYFCVENQKKISLKNICLACDVSPGHVANIARRMLAANRSQIKLLKIG